MGKGEVVVGRQLESLLSEDQLGKAAEALQIIPCLDVS